MNGRYMDKKMLTIGLITALVFNIYAETKVACIGNSITSGYMNTGFSYVPKLDTLLGNGYNVQNFGVSGTTLLKKGDSPYWNTYNFKQALAFGADIVTIKLGTNDTKVYNWDYHKDEYKKDYEALLDTLNTNTKKPIIFPVFPVPIFTNSVSVSWGMRDSIISKYEIPIIKEIAAKRGLTYIDAYTPLLPFSKYFTVDGVHPSKAAADSIAYIIYRGIVAATQSIVNRTNIPSRQQVNTVYSVYNGNVSNAFTGLIPGFRYELSIYGLNGVLVGRTLVDVSSASQAKAKHLLTNTSGTKFLLMKKSN